MVLVLGRHFNESLVADSPVLLTWHRGGWIGVDLFFVLSGYLISGLIYQEVRTTGAFSCGRFLIRRAFKIYPAFWCLIAFTVAWRMAISLRDGDGAWQAMEALAKPTAIELLFVQNYWQGLWNHTWSLAVEEHFYIGLAAFAAWAVHANPKAPFRALPTIFALTAAACLLLRWRAASGEAAQSYYHSFFPTHLRVDSLMFGVVARQAADALPSSFARSVPSRLLLSTIGIACFIPAFLIEPEPGSVFLVLAPPLLATGSVALLMAARAQASSDFVASGFIGLMAAAGACSYSTYLWHMPVEIVASRISEKWFGGSCLAYLPLYLLGSLLVGHLMFRLIEQPVLAIRDRISPSRRAGAVTQT